MRERETCSPGDNRAVCTITPTYYDRRALDTNADYALCTSLAYLADLAQQSPKIRDSLASDGGLEQIVRILKRGKVKRMPERWQLVKWQSALLCLFNIGVRGSEYVRTRVVEADMIPVVVTVLCHTLEKLDRATQYARYLASQQRHTLRQVNGNHLSRSTTMVDAPITVQTTIEASQAAVSADYPLPPVRRVHAENVLDDDDTDENATPQRPSTPLTRRVTDRLVEQLGELSVSTAAAAAAAAASDTGHRLRPGRQTHERLERGPGNEPDMNESDDGYSMSEEANLAAFADAGVRVASIADEVVSAHEMALALHAQAPVSTSSPAGAPGTETTVDEEAASARQSMIEDPGREFELSRPINTPQAPRLSTRPFSMPAAPVQTQQASAAADIVMSAQLDQDVVMCLKLLAYLSKYPSLRELFQHATDMPLLKQNLKQYEYYISSDHAEGPFETMDEDLSDDLQMPYNVFSLVEKFTARPPDEAAYWAGVTMRNACRKDESRGGVRQCAYLECGKWEESNRQFAKCRRCRRTKYCSKQCQSNAWPGHKWWCSASRDHDTNNGTTSHPRQ
ncbi:hypothetical protein PYCC9005_001078 [Savitreella phatthalungensis]